MNPTVGAVVVYLCFVAVQGVAGNKNTNHDTPFMTSGSRRATRTTSLPKSGTLSTTNHHPEEMINFGNVNMAYDISFGQNLDVIKSQDDYQLTQLLEKGTERTPDQITNITRLPSLSSMAVDFGTVVEAEETSRISRLSEETEKRTTIAESEMVGRKFTIDYRNDYNDAIDGSKHVQFPLGSYFDYAAVQDQFNDDTRNLQSDTCSPFNTAIPVPFDPTGETVTVITGDTTGADSNLISLAGCVVDSGAPTMWYQFTTNGPARIGLTT